MSGSRASVRWIVTVSALVLLAGPRISPLVPVSWILPLSILWYLALAAFLWAGFLILSRWIGRVGAMVPLGLGVIVPILLTAVPLSPHLGVRHACPRNWTWRPTWLLRSSPMGSVTFEIGGAAVKVCYGRPAARGRTMIGGPRVPFGRLWRTGANEPTTIISERPLEVAGVAVPAGRTALYTIPGPESWEIILNGSTSQWGIESEYSDAVRARELGRAILPSNRTLDFVERLTLSAEPDREGGSDLVLEWENTRVRIPIRLSSR